MIKMIKKVFNEVELSEEQLELVSCLKSLHKEKRFLTYASILITIIYIVLFMKYMQNNKAVLCIIICCVFNYYIFDTLYKRISKKQKGYEKKLERSVIQSIGNSAENEEDKKFFKDLLDYYDKKNKGE